MYFLPVSVNIPVKKSIFGPGNTIICVAGIQAGAKSRKNRIA
jgi:hypothetical protein